MVVLAVALFAALSSCAFGCSGSTNSMLPRSDRTVLSFCHAELTELEPWRMENQPLDVQLAAIFREMESLKCEQTTLQQRQNALTQMHLKNHWKRVQENVGTHMLTYDTNHDDEEEEEDSLNSSEEDSRRQRDRDPCYHYTVLDQAWRATNTTTKTKMCDRNVKWKGWYRLYYRGRSLQMPERCVPVNKCGTHAPLWLAGTHPKRREGIVTRNVCGHWKEKCCAFPSTPIKVKRCRGNYYVYEFTAPSTCYMAYCADINTIVCGTCRRNEHCESRDKINWRCKRKKKPLRKIHFFASYPGQITGKMNRIMYNNVLVNMGQGYNRRTGVFRAPVRGIYQFFFSTQTADKGLRTDLWLVVNGYWVAVSHTHITRNSTVGSLSTYMTYLSRGASVYVTQNHGISWANAASTTIIFGGSLLAQFT